MIDEIPLLHFGLAGFGVFCWDHPPSTILLKQIHEGQNTTLIILIFYTSFCCGFLCSGLLDAGRASSPGV